MSARQELWDRIEIEALQWEFTDAVMMNDHDRLASLFVPDGSVRMPDGGVQAIGREQIHRLSAARQERFSVFVQATHPGAIDVTGDTARGRAFMSELIVSYDGTSASNRAVYHDHYRRTPEGWRFVERVYEVRYLDTAPLPGGPVRGGDA